MLECAEFKPMWDLIPMKMRGDVGGYVKFGARPSDFLFAVLKHDLWTAIQMADEENARRIVGWHKFIELCVPEAAHGTSKNIYDWQEKGGLYGILK